mgnify:CR=1 FL=1
MEIVKKNKTNTSCFCEKKKIQKYKIIYKFKPYGETDFKIRKKNYFRAYHQCTKCQHYFACHNFDLEKLYQKNYSQKTYGSQKKIRNTFEKIIKTFQNYEILGGRKCISPYKILFIICGREW